jgi:chromosome segregation ATPase
MDTGVSTDSYAIIELGMVDDIIKDKENSRRKMLEQAAGITIYKTRKKEAKLNWMLQSRTCTYRRSCCSRSTTS